MKQELLTVGLAIGDILLKSLILLGLGWMFVRLARRSSAAVRHMVWLLTLGSIVCVPALEFVPAFRSLYELRPTVQAPVVLPEPITSTDPVDSRALDDLLKDPALSTADLNETAPVPTPQAAPRPLVGWAVLAWAGGGFVVLLSGVIGSLAVRRIRTSAFAFPSSVQPIRAVKLTRSREPRPPSALTWGAVRPTILLPKSADSWPEHRLQTVLVHELEHVRRWDATKQLVGVAACAVYWFNPLVWLAAKAARAEAEAATDDAVLRAGVKPSTYANTLMDVAAEIGLHPRMNATAGVAFMKHSKIEARVRAILDTRVRRTVSLWETLAATAIAFSLLGSLSVVKAAASRPFADLPAGTAQNVVVHKQSAAEKRAAAQHARHLKAIAARLHAKQKEYDHALLRAQHLQSSIEQLQQKLGNPKNKVVYWRLPDPNRTAIQKQLIEQQRLQAMLQKQLSEALVFKTQALTLQQPSLQQPTLQQPRGPDKPLSISLKISEDDLRRQLDLLSKENQQTAEAQRRKALAEALVASAAAKANVAQAIAIEAQDKRASELITALALKEADKAATKSLLDQAKASDDIAKANAEIRAAKMAAEQADQAKGKTSADIAEKKALLDADRAIEAQTRAKLKAKLNGQADTLKLYGRLQGLFSSQDQTPAEIAKKIRVLKAKLASGKLKSAERKHTKLEIEKLQLLQRLRAIESELSKLPAK